MPWPAGYLPDANRPPAAAVIRPETSAAAILRAAKPTGVREVEDGGGQAGTDPAQFDGDDAGAAADI
jgi:hypothetical protein